MDDRLREAVSRIMFSSDTEKLKQVILEFYRKHDKDVIAYPKERYELMKSDDAMNTEWLVDDVIVSYLMNNDLADRVILV